MDFMDMLDMFDIENEYMCDFNCAQCNRIYCSIADEEDGED